MPQKIYDVSRTISPELVVWPGDTPFSYEHSWKIQDGSSVNLTRLTFSPHLGTHADAPWHVSDEGGHPADVPVEKYIGPAHVVTITRRYGGIVPTDFAGCDLSGMKRLLVHTWVSDVPDNQWPDDFPYPTVELADWLGQQGVILLGVDSPSMDAFTSKDLGCHKRLLDYGIVNVEFLKLSGVPDGVYELIALPLKFADVCGSPVRAILRSY